MASVQQATAPDRAGQGKGAPPVNSLPRYPATWYRFCASRDLRSKPLSKTMLGQRMVAYRTASGEAAVLDARCSHLGADLGRGTVDGDNLVCPFHGWAYGPSGACTRVPGEPCVPAFARQTKYPAVERHGSLYVFNGAGPLFPLPFFAGEDADDYVAGRAFAFLADCAWYMIPANGFDLAHFRTVHDRTITSPPLVDCPDEFSRRIRYETRVTGDSIFDVLLRPTVGSTVDVTITSWGGPHLLVAGSFRRAESRILITARPLDCGKTSVEVIVFAPRRGSLPGARLQEWVSLEVRRLFTRGFLQHDLDLLSGISYRPESLLSSEQELIDFFNWLSELPQGAQGAPQEKGRRLQSSVAPGALS